MMKTRMRSVLEQAVSVALIVIGGIAFVYFYSIVNASQRQEIQRLIDGNRVIDNEIIAATEELQRLRADCEQKRAEVERRRQEIEERFEKLLTGEDEYSNLIRAIEQKAANFNIAITQSEYVPPTQAGGVLAKYKVFTMRLKVLGDYDRMKHFLWELENRLGPFVKINTFKVIQLSDPDGQMNLDLELVTYFKPIRPGGK